MEKRYSISLYNPSIPLVISAMRHESARQITFCVEEDLSGFAGVLLDIVRQDGVHVLGDCTVDLEDHLVKATLPVNALTETGNLAAQLHFYQGDRPTPGGSGVEGSGIMCSFPFSIMVRYSTIDGSDAYEQSFGEAFDRADQAQDTADQVQTEVDALEPRVATNEQNISGLTTRMGTMESYKSRVSAAEADIDVLEGRVNNFTRLATGSTTGDAELTDIRVGADGTNYASAGESIRGQITKLQDEINNISTVIDLPYTPVVEHTYIVKSSGEVSNPLSQNIFSTDFIPVLEGQTIVLNHNNGVSDLRGYAFYSKSKDFISGGGYIAGEQSLTLTVPENACYMRATGNMTNPDKFHVYALIGEALQNLIKNDGIATELRQPITLEWVNGQYINIPTGAYTHYEQGDSDFRTSGISVIPGETYIINGASNNLAALYALKSGDALVSIFPTSSQPTTEHSVTITIPPEVDTMLVGRYIKDTSVFKIVNTDIVSGIHPVIENVVENQITQTVSEVILQSIPIPYRLAMDNILCMGDSLTSGANYTEAWGEMASTGSSVEQNYPYYLSRILNTKVTNAGVSGFSASDWYKKYILTDPLDLTQYNTFILWFGTNYGCNSMPTDTEIANFTPEANPDPATANQALYEIWLINKIREANPNALIVLAKAYASKSTTATHNAVIDQIAQKYGLFAIDTMDLSPASNPVLHENINNPHFNKAGNIYIANKFAKEIEAYFNADPLRCGFGQSSRQHNVYGAEPKNLY